jgi:hypothetical protein
MPTVVCTARDRAKRLRAPIAAVHRSARRRRAERAWREQPVQVDDEVAHVAVPSD